MTRTAPVAAEREAPLRDVRVLDLSRLLPGDLCTLLLADLGAGVIKVEDTKQGDYMRWDHQRVAGPPASTASPMFAALNRNKRSVQIDLKTPSGREVLLHLARNADVLVESFRPGVMDRLGVGWETLSQENPRLVYCAISGFGQHGPLSGRPGHDINYLARNGLLALNRDRDGAPQALPILVADIGGGALTATIGILTALHERTRSGKGQLVDVAMTDGSLAWLSHVAATCLATDQQAPTRDEWRLGGSFACYTVYACEDGWVAVGAFEEKFWANLCHAIERPDLIEGQWDRVGSATHRALEEIFLTRPRSWWQAVGEEHDCCLDPVLEMTEALASPLIAERNMVVSVQQPGYPNELRQIGPPVKLSAAPAEPATAPAPGLGEHTAEVLLEAGFSREEIERLESAGAIVGPG